MPAASRWRNPPRLARDRVVNGGTMRASGVWQALERARRANLHASGEPAPVVGEAGHTRRQVILALAAVAALPRELHAATKSAPSRRPL